MAFLAGCMPTGHPEPYSQELLDSIKVGVSKKKDVRTLLGQPSAVRRDGDIWIYGQSRLAAIGIGPYGPGVAGFDDYNWMLVEFRDEAVAHVEAVEDGWGCTTTGICLLSYAYERGRETSKPEFTVVTSKQEDDEAAKLFRVISERCAVYLYAADTAGEVSFETKSNVQIVNSAYMYDLLTPGSYKISIKARSDQMADLQIVCEDGDVLYVELFYGKYIWSGKPRIRLVDQAEGRASIAERSLVLLP